MMISTLLIKKLNFKSVNNTRILHLIQANYTLKYEAFLSEDELLQLDKLQIEN